MDQIVYMTAAAASLDVPEIVSKTASKLVLKAITAPSVYLNE